MWPVLVLPLLGLGLAACGAVLARSGPSVGRTDPAAAVGLAAAAVGCAAVAVWLLAALLAVLAVLAERRRWVRVGRLCRRLSPALLRRAAATVLGAQLLVVPAAVADDAPSPFWPGGDATAAVGEQLPGTGTAPARPAPPPVAPPDEGTRGGAAPPLSVRTVDGTVTVVRGDTLWSLAAAQLGAGASDAQIAAAWPVWYQHNRHVLTDGPDRLLPGQQLLVPGTGSG